ncbi:MAG: phospho-sugar mutase [Spirochaetes bacterium]|nr:phospho-sugar mutase [Spirochaetota bacterium]
MNDLIRKRIDEWTKGPYDRETIEEIEGLVRSGDEKELEDRFFQTLEFGTGGLRGIIGAGTNRMNLYTVGMATQGLANYILKAEGAPRGVVIARDSRRMSDLFAHITAEVLAGNGIRVYIFEDITPTPIASFAVRELGAISGVVVTASHNPSDYNGYKVYWDDGGQVIPPHDANIIDEVKRVDDVGSIRRTDFDDAVKSGLITVLGHDITEKYIARLERYTHRPVGDSTVSIVYTPLHGTGYRIIPEVLSHFGFGRVSAVEEQSRPDGSFPTVKYPNPEEKEALALSLDLARRIDADLILATDPDADRMGVGFKDGTGEYVLINGNQIGTMLEYYILTRLRESGRMPENGVVVKTIVTTDLQRIIADSFGCRTDDVLTGFKWIAAAIKRHEEGDGSRFLFGGEESYGYLPVDFLRDKDAVSSCYFFAEMADWLAGRGMRLAGFLEEIYRTYGLYMEDLLSLTLKGRDGIDRIQQIMSSLRNEPPMQFIGIDVDRVADIQNLEVLHLPERKRTPIRELPKSDVLQFFLTDESKITVRPSGTEPKIKFYFSIRDAVGSAPLVEMQAALRAKIDSMKKDMLAKIDAM